MTVEQVAEAFIVGRSGKCHNAATDGTAYKLHQSNIAVKVGKEIHISFCGHYTPTTASHINAVLKAAGKRQRVSYALARDGKEPDTFVV